MKRNLSRCGALLLALLLLFAAVPVRAADSNAYGVLYHSADTPLHTNVTYTKNVFWSDYYKDLRQENYFTYTPGGPAWPVVVSGDSVTSRLTGSAAAADQASLGRRVVAGINGDFFVSTGNPIGLMISEGRLLSSDGGLPAIGFLADGTAIAGSPAMKMTVTGGSGGDFRLAELNKVRDSHGVYAYTSEFNSRRTTGTVVAGIEVLLTPLDSYENFGGPTVPAIGHSVIYRVTSVSTESATTIGPGQLVLSVNEQSGEEAMAHLRALQPGEELTLTITANDERWNDVVSAMGGLYYLVQEGKSVPSTEKGNAPRTAIGVRENGEVLLYTVDGRRTGYSVGASMTVLGERLAELGCVTAICLDGGGSTTALATMPDSLDAALLNRPSDGKERNVTNLLLLVTDDRPNNTVGGVYFRDPGPYILTGASVALTGNLVDTNYIPIQRSPDTFTASAGTIDGNVFTAPDRPGQVALTAKDGSFTAERTVTAVAAPEKLTVSANGAAAASLVLKPGEQLQLTAGGTYHTFDVLCANTDFTWALSEGMGTVDENGLLTVSKTPGSGTLRVSRGSLLVELPVTITTLPLITQEDFEGDVSRYYGYGVTLAKDTAYVRFGSASLRVDYAQDENGAAFFTGWEVPDGYDRLLLSVYGDGSGNTVSFYDDKGVATPAFTLDFTGWRQLDLPVPEGAGKINAMIVTGEKAEGTIWLDQAVSSYGTVVDTTPPVINGTLEERALDNGGSAEEGAVPAVENVLTAMVVDTIDGKLGEGDLRLTLDGKPLAFTMKNGTLTATLPAAEHSQRVTLTAWDHSGNRARQSWDVTVEGETVYADLGTAEKPHWAAPFMTYLSGRGVINGYAENDTMLAKPDKPLSRAEFAVMLYRWLGLQAEDFEHVQLPFKDVEKLQDWVLPAARAMYAMGVIQGSGDGQGGVTFDGGSTLTRAQAVTMLGRIQEKGYPIGGLEIFSDAETVPAWARDYIATMTAQGILNGIDGALRPNDTMTRGQAAKILWAMG